MPEVTENYVHLPVRDKGSFVDGSFRTITISASEGIKAVIGKLKSNPGGSTKVQKYLFDTTKGWTMAKAKSWVGKHSVKESTDEWPDEYIAGLPDTAFLVPERRWLPVLDHSNAIDEGMLLKAARADLSDLEEHHKGRLKMMLDQKGITEQDVVESLSGVLDSASVDRMGGFIRGVKLLGENRLDQGNNIVGRYTERARKGFAELMNGKPWYINHPPRDDPNKVRDVRDLGGTIENARSTSAGVFGDLRVAANQLWVFDLVESVPQAVGMSLNGRAWTKQQDKIEVIEEAHSVRSVDMVTDPATTRTMFEGKTEEEAMDFEKLTAAMLLEHRADIVQDLQKEVRESMDEKLAELQQKLEAKDKELAEANANAKRLEEEKVAADKATKVKTLIAEAKFPEDFDVSVLTDSMMRAPDDEAMAKIVNEYKAIFGRPHSYERKDGVLDEKRASELAEAAVAAMKH